MGRPDCAIFFGAGLGDELLCGSVAHELKKRGARRIVMFSRYPELFAHNPDIAGVHPYGYATAGRMNHWGYRCAIPQYAVYDAATDVDITPNEHFLETMCRKAGLSGSIDLRTYFHLTPAEKEAGRLPANQAVIHSTGLPIMANKRWPAERYQAVADALQDRVQWIQLGLAEDSPIAGAIDLRGKTSLRESAALLANSQVFLGQAGFLMHLARAVDTRSVIVYGGREDPAVSGYVANENIVGRTPCSFCWQRTRCDFGHECMQMIGVEPVAAAVRRQLERYGSPLETQQSTIQLPPHRSAAHGFQPSSRSALA
jgi:ADP-heptose:LPS heptosyltransferase